MTSILLDSNSSSFSCNLIMRLCMHVGSRLQTNSSIKREIILKSITNEIENM